MAVGAEPVDVQPVGVEVLDRRSRDDSSIDNRVREDRIVGAPELLPQTGVDPVCGDSGVGMESLAVRREQGHAGVVLVDPLDPHPGPQDA